MADNGNLASFTFGAETYDQDDCVSGFALNDAINEVIFQCGGMDKGTAGTRSATFSISLAIASDDVDKVNAFTPGTKDAFEAHPGGDTTGNVEVAATEALVTSRNLSAPVNGVQTMDVAFRLNDITIEAAA